MDKFWERATTHVSRRLARAAAALRRWGVEMLGAMEKGIQAARIQTPPKGVIDGVDLRTLPKFVAFKAALLREKLALTRLLVLVSAGFSLYFAISRIEVSHLYDALRVKEYILAPGVVDLTTASPESVPDSYVEHAAMSFLTELGNINAENVDEEYRALTSFMAPDMKMRFMAEAESWVARVKEAQLTEAMTILSRRVETNGSGKYKVTAHVKTDTYVQSEHLGARNEVIEMELVLVPPKDGKRWFLEIAALSRTSADAFKATLPKAGREER